MADGRSRLKRVLWTVSAFFGLLVALPAFFTIFPPPAGTGPSVGLRWFFFGLWVVVTVPLAFFAAQYAKRQGDSTNAEIDQLRQAVLESADTVASADAAAAGTRVAVNAAERRAVARSRLSAVLDSAALGFPGTLYLALYLERPPDSDAVSRVWPPGASISEQVPPEVAQAWDHPDLSFSQQIEPSGGRFARYGAIATMAFARSGDDEAVGVLAAWGSGEGADALLNGSLEGPLEALVDQELPEALSDEVVEWLREELL